MNGATANKLLKILEEPPEKTVFLLVSQNPEQLLPTILSRVQLVHVKPIAKEDLAKALVQNFGQDQTNAETISKIAQGNYLEAQKLVSENEVRAFNQEMFIQWMRFLWQKEFLELIQWSETMSKIGRERLMLFFRYGLHVFRESLIMNYSDNSIQMTGGAEMAFIAKFSPYVNELNAVDMVQLFEKAEYHISRNANAKILIMDVSLKMMKLVRKKVS
jgi:DNA polymerase-3 subunit delta'